MNRHTVSLAVLIVAATIVVAVPAAGIGPGSLAGSKAPASDVTDGAANETSTEAAANGTDEEVPPGATLAGVVGVQGAEIEAEIGSRGFEIALNRSGDNASKRAGVIASQVTDLEARLEELRGRTDELDRAREEGNITEGEYRARIAEVVTRITAVQRLANQTAKATRGIPAETLRERGIDADAIEELGRNARNLSGPEVAAIARGIAGPGAGTGLGGGPPVNRTGQGDGPPGNGDGNSGVGSPATPGSNAGNNGSGGADGGSPESASAGDDSDGPAGDERGNGTAADRTTPENRTEPGAPGDGRSSGDRSVTDDGNTDVGQVRDTVARADGTAVVPSVGG